MISKQQITEMFELQDRLNRHINRNWKNADYNWPTAIMAECQEVVDQVGWKWWKQYERATPMQINLEVVDIWHFLLSAYLECGAGTTSLVQARIKQEPDHWFIGKPVDDAHIIRRAQVLSACAGTYGVHEPLRMLPEFFSLMRACRLSFDDLEQLYRKKATLNLFRLDNGYRSNQYVKDWLGEEDNVYLEKIITENPKLATAEIEKLLSGRYAEVLAARRIFPNPHQRTNHEAVSD